MMLHCQGTTLSLNIAHERKFLIKISAVIFEQLYRIHELQPFYRLSLDRIEIGQVFVWRDLG